MRTLHAPLALAALLLGLPACGVLGIGKSGADLELDMPRLDVDLTLDEASYGVGAPIIATVTIRNIGDAPISVPRPSADTVRFFVVGSADNEPRDTQSVRWPNEQPEFVTLETDQTDVRPFVLNMATSDAGPLEVFAIYRTEPDPEIELAANEASEPVSIEVTLPVALERDTMGLISEAEAHRIATRYFGRSAKRVDSLLVRDSKLRMHQWWVTVWYSSPTADGRTNGSCLIDPFLGKVRKEADRPVTKTGS